MTNGSVYAKRKSLKISPQIPAAALEMNMYMDIPRSKRMMNRDTPAQVFENI